MINRIVAWLLSALNVVLVWVSWPVVPAGQKLNLDNFTLTWSDEFDGDSLDREKWSLRGSSSYPMPRVDGFWCYETTDVRDGMLYISSVYAEEGLGGGPTGYYTSGLHTSGTFSQTFGYFEVRAKLPKGDGLWSAFWLQSDNIANVDGSGRDGSEIDIYESFYYTQCWPKKDSVSAAIYFDYGALQGHGVCWGQVKNPYDTFHTYGVEWNENEYIFYIDGTEYGRSTLGGVCQTELFLILSVEHTFNAWWGGDIRNNKPSDMTDFVVDYVRVYQYK